MQQDTVSVDRFSMPSWKAAKTSAAVGVDIAENGSGKGQRRTAGLAMLEEFRGCL